MNPSGFWHILLVLVLALGVTGTSAVRTAEERGEPGGLTGQLLVATEQMPDPRFWHSVIYMVQHDATGAMGLIVNRPLGEVPIARLLEELGTASQGVSGDIRVHYGGPVDEARGFVLHTADYQGRGTLLINNGVALTRRPEILRAIAAGTGPRRSLFALGYAGWAPGQLEGEIEAGHWVAVPADEALVFDEDYEGKWKRAMARRTIEL